MYLQEVSAWWEGHLYNACDNWVRVIFTKLGVRVRVRVRGRVRVRVRVRVMSRINIPVLKQSAILFHLCFFRTCQKETPKVFRETRVK